MDLGDLAGVPFADWLIVIFFGGFFVLGFAQGTIRRLIGLASVTFSFLLAANVAEPLATFLRSNWTDQNPAYSYMIGFLTVFVAASLAFAIVAQGFYHPQPLFQKARFLDEIIGGLLGLVQAAVILGALIIILDSYYRLGQEPRSTELGFLRDLWTFLDTSRIVDIFRDTLIPAFFVLVGLFIPSNLKAMYPGGAS